MRLPKTVIAKLAVLILTVLKAVRLDTPNRLVIALSPLFTPAAGAIMVFVAHNLPVLGRRLTTAEMTGLFFTGAMFAATHLIVWLHGWQKHEAHSTTPAPPRPAAVASGPAPAATPPAPHVIIVGSPPPTARAVAEAVQAALRVVPAPAPQEAPEPSPSPGRLDTPPVETAPPAHDLMGADAAPPPIPQEHAPVRDVGLL